MGNTPLLTVRCPQDLKDSIKKTMAETGKNQTEVVIDMLRNSVPSLSIMERAKLPKVPAIYFVITPHNKLLYIGGTKNLFNRWLQHHRYQQFIEADPNTRVAWFEFDESDRSSMPAVEDELITLLDTKYNGTDAPQIKNPRITAYVKQDIFDRFDEYCQKWEVKHSKGIELLLTEYFTGNTPDVTLDPQQVSAGISEDKVKALIDEKLAAITHSSSTPSDAVDKEKWEKQVKKLSSVLDRVAHLENTLDNSEKESNDAFLKELDRRDERINEVNTKILERVSHLELASNSLSELVTKNDLAEVKDAIAALLSQGLEQSKNKLNEAIEQNISKVDECIINLEDWCQDLETEIKELQADIPKIDRAIERTPDLELDKRAANDEKSSLDAGEAAANTEKDNESLPATESISLPAETDRASELDPQSLPLHISTIIASATESNQTNLAIEDSSLMERKDRLDQITAPLAEASANLVEPNRSNFSQPQPKVLSKTEAYQLACDRGYRSSLAAFSQFFVDAKRKRQGKDEILHGICKAQERGKYIDLGFNK